ncbi:MAG: hypothetical protein QXT39_06080 [Conexivisphaerales archaeon]
MKNNFFLKVEFSRIAELIDFLVQHCEELRITREGENAGIEARGLEMDAALSARLAILYPEIEVNIIEDGKRERFEPDLPVTLRGILNCPNPNCVTSQPREPALPEFVVVSRRPILLLCTYCGRYLNQKGITAELFKVNKKVPL